MLDLLDVYGPTIQLLTSPSEVGLDYCVMKGIIPPGVFVPLHSHPDDESFFQLAGYVQLLSQRGDDLEWHDIRTGSFVHLPGRTKHAFRNVSERNAEQLVVSTSRLGRFFQEIGRPVHSDHPLPPPSPADLKRLLKIAEEYQYWMASPAENAAVGIISYT